MPTSPTPDKRRTNLRDLIRSNTRALAGGGIFAVLYIICPLLYSLMSGESQQHLFNIWASGLYPALILLGCICAKPAKSADRWNTVISGFGSGLIPVLPILLPSLLLAGGYYLWLIFSGLGGKSSGESLLALGIIGLALIPVPFAGGLGGMLRNLYFNFKNRAEFAFEFLTQAAENGNAAAQADLAAMYCEGRGTPRDYNKAAEWFAKAAEQEDAEARCTLGVMYYEGLGVTKDLQKAAEWLTKAADQGCIRAQKNLEIMHAKGLDR